MQRTLENLIQKQLLILATEVQIPLQKIPFALFTVYNFVLLSEGNIQVKFTGNMFGTPHFNLFCNIMV